MNDNYTRATGRFRHYINTVQTYFKVDGDIINIGLCEFGKTSSPTHGSLLCSTNLEQQKVLNTSA